MLAKASIKWGLFLGIALVMGTQILTWLGLGLTSWFPIVTFLFVIVFVALGLGDIKQQQEGKLTFAQAGIAVVVMVLISRMIFQLYMFVYINYIDPNWVNDVAESWTKTMQNSDMSAEQIDQRIAIFRRAWETLPMFTVEIFFMAIPQIVLGLIAAMFFVLRKRASKPSQES